MEFLKATNEKMETKYILLDFYQKSKRLYYFISISVLRLQKVNRFRIFAFKNRIAYLKYYWENLKTDLAKVLMAEKKASDLANALSIKIFSIREEVRDMYLSWYVVLAKELYTLRFVMWRMRKLKALGHTFTFVNWEQQRDLIVHKCKWLEGQLFMDLDFFAMHTLVRAIQGDPVEPEKPLKKQKTSKVVLTSLSFADVKFEKEPSCLVKLEEEKLYTKFEDIVVEAAGAVEACPNFVFMPSKVQVMKLILKASHFQGLKPPVYVPPTKNNS